MNCHMLYVLQVRDGLGPQIRTNIMMSIASGCQPEHLYGFISKIRSAVVFTCDPKETAYRFACEQGFKSCHHFVDGRPLSVNGEGLCATHGFRVCCIVREMDADIFLAGISCKPYSLARTGCFSEDGGNFTRRCFHAPHLHPPRQEAPAEKSPCSRMSMGSYSRTRRGLGNQGIRGFASWCVLSFRIIASSATC